MVHSPDEDTDLFDIVSGVLLNGIYASFILCLDDIFDR